MADNVLVEFFVCDGRLAVRIDGVIFTERDRLPDNIAQSIRNHIKSLLGIEVSSIDEATAIISRAANEYQERTEYNPDGTIKRTSIVAHGTRPMRLSDINEFVVTAEGHIAININAVGWAPQDSEEPLGRWETSITLQTPSSSYEMVKEMIEVGACKDCVHQLVNTLKLPNFYPEIHASVDKFYALPTEVH